MRVPFRNDDSDSSDDEDDLPALIEEAVHSGTLQLSNRMLEAVPGSLEACAGLCRLDLSSNSLSELPASIAGLVCLEHLDVAWNKLSALPPELGSLTALATLRASYNQITALPAEVAALPSLICLDLSDNKLTALPARICQSQFLTELRVDFNSIQELPRELFRITTLLELGLEGNPLRDPPKAVVSEGTGAVLDHLRSLLFGRAPSRPGSSASPRRPGSAVSGGDASAGPQVLVVEAAGEDPGAFPGADAFVGDLVLSPGKEHKPYDEEMDMEAAGRDRDGETDWGALGAGPGRRTGASSLDQILESMRLDETDGDLGGGAEAVLQRTANLLATGLQEMQSGRPLTAGAEARVAKGAVGRAAPRPATASRRPGTAVLGGRSRPMSAALPRPGTASAVHGASVSSSGTGSRPATASWLGGRPSTASYASAPRPSWLDRAGVASSGGLLRTQGPPETAARRRQYPPSASEAAPHAAAGAMQGADAAADTLLLSMPALTFPLAASMSKLSRNKIGAKLTSAGGGEVPLGRGGASARGKRPSTEADLGDDAEEGDDEDDDDIVERIVGARNPALLQAIKENR